jgi:hypothetical protein
MRNQKDRMAMSLNQVTDEMENLSRDGHVHSSGGLIGD